MQNTPITIPIKSILMLVDNLISARDTENLQYLSDFVYEIILTHQIIAAEDSFVSLNDYICLAIDQIDMQVDSADILSSEVRPRL